MFATPEPGEEEDEPVIDKTSHEAWGAEQRKLIEEGKRPEFDHSYVPLLSNSCRDGRTRLEALSVYQLYGLYDELLRLGANMGLGI